MATFLKEYPFMSEYYYWNVLTVEKRTLMLSDAIRVVYDKKKKSGSGGKSKDIVEEIRVPEGGKLSDLLM